MGTHQWRKIYRSHNFLLKHEIDTGEIVLQEKAEILDSDNFGTMYEKLKLIGASLVIKTVELLLEDKIKTIPQSQLHQNNEFLQIAPKIFKETCQIDWKKTAHEVFNFYKRSIPYPTSMDNI